MDGAHAQRRFYPWLDIRALQRMSPIERYAEIEAMVTRPEWQPEAIFQRLRGKRLADVKI